MVAWSLGAKHLTLLDNRRPHQRFSFHPTFVDRLPPEVFYEKKQKRDVGRKEEGPRRPPTPLCRFLCTCPMVVTIEINHLIHHHGIVYGQVMLPFSLIKVFFLLTFQDGV